ncbi:hypothetical protein NPS53_09365 [Pseudomonas putida]|uniref:hypothetical protein n=1 Tax=Pseudomonas putida TaxID=303 RepID=UPI002363AAE0|nr:hypothetical protein [Pseudomonas putida]MDD2139785.1 hypothetical protein [Pseudomonas putida]HDS1721709.1 hypothetical protein [Pseudomonas putida]
MSKSNITRFLRWWVLGFVGFIGWRLYFELPLAVSDLLGGAVTQCLLVILAMGCFALGEHLASRSRLE